MIPSEKPFRMLFLCTGNSARSILAEYLARQVAPHRMISCSAGSDPKGEVHPMTIRVLKEVFQIDASDARSKSWDEFQGQDFDFVVTVCDHARDLPLVAGTAHCLPLGLTGSGGDGGNGGGDFRLLPQRRV
ncbi:MAG: arsenate reductase ArsC [Verrucomicrobiales bacterium]